MFAALGRLAYRRRRWVIAVSIVFMVVAMFFGTTVFDHLKQGGFEDKNSESFKAAQAIDKNLGQAKPSLIVLFTAKDSLSAKDPSYRQAVEQTLGKISSDSSVQMIQNFYSTGSNQFVSRDGRSTFALVSLKGDDEQQQKEAEKLRPRLKSDKLQVRLGGPSAVGQEIGSQIQNDLAKAEQLTFPILGILLVIIFRSFIAAALPLLLAGLTILGAFLLTRIVTTFTDVSIFAINVITTLGLGLSIDYSLFIVSRFREELRGGLDPRAAIEKTLQTAGRTVFFSGITVIVSMLGLIVFPLGFLKSMGIGGSASVLFAVIAALTVLPAILVMLGRRVNSLSFGTPRRDRLAAKAGVRPAARSGTSGILHRLSHFVMRYPVTIILATVIPLIIVGLPFLRANFSSPDYRTLPAGKESRIVGEILDRDFSGQSDPVQIVLKAPSNMLERQNVGAVYDYVQRLKQVAGVKTVQSLVSINPSLDKTAYEQLYSQASNNPQTQALASQFSRDSYGLVQVYYSGQPQSGEARKLVKSIRALSPPTNMTVEVGGTSAQLVDLLHVLAKYIPYGLVFIVVAVFILLFLMLGSIVIPIKAVIMNFLSLSAAFGALVWIFQDGHLASLLGFTSTGSINATQPILLFAVAFGLSMDYAVFLLSRIKEQYDKTGNNTEAVALGVEKTGGIITAAALLLIVVFAAFATSKVAIMKQLAIGWVIAVAVDAVIIRLLLVPATMRLLGRYNWWAPRPLRRLYKRLGISET